MQYILIEPIQAHKLLQKIWHDAKNQLMAGHKQVVDIGNYEDKLTALQRRYYHGYVLNEIAKQAKVEDRHYDLKTWKEYYRKTILGDRIETITDPMTGANYKEVVRVSTEELSVKQYTNLIERVKNLATEELKVNFYLDFDTYTEENSL